MELHDLNREAVAQGCVLLRNDGGVLPFSPADDVSVFGRCQLDFYKSGTGSGGSVHVPYSTNLIDGFDFLRSGGFPLPRINGRLVSAYRNWVKETPFDDGGGAWAGEPWFQKEMPLDTSLLSGLCAAGGKAVFVLGRTAGEDMDNRAEKGSYYLTDEERHCLELLCAHFAKVVVVLNVPNIIDLSWIDGAEFRGHIAGVLFCWHGGMDGGAAVAEVLCGAKYPSGKLSDTIAYRIEDYPSAAHFGSADDELYAEDIFVGYRYFSTFAPEKVQFPFGFGLGYTTFALGAGAVSFSGGTFCAKLSVTNTGAARGRETVQLYAECPQGALGKSRRVLCGWQKTPELGAGETCEVEISFGEREISSYDDSGKSGNRFCSVIEAGEYRFFAGNSSADCKEISFEGGSPFTVARTRVLERLSQCCAPRTPFERLSASGGYESVPVSETDLSARIQERLPREIPFTGNRGITFDSVRESPALIDDFVAQLDDGELMTLVRGEGMLSRKVTLGIASAFGGVSERLHDIYRIPVAGCADGPSGIRLDTGGEASLIPIGTLLACTWNDALVEELYGFVGAELSEWGIDLLLGPGCNIHRNPLNGRNFEYYSEDPLLSGKMAAAACRGIAARGSFATIKHFACNNQESHRRTENSVVSERALREIYLRPFEIAVKEGNARAVMTGYNGVNGLWCASNYDLTQTILRGEWGFCGIVMSDWWAGMTDPVLGNASASASPKALSAMVRSRNDLFMVVPNDTADKGGLGDDLARALEEKTLSRAELQRCAKDVLLFLAQTPAARSPLRPLRVETIISGALPAAPQGFSVYEADCTFPTDAGKAVCVHIPEKGTYNISATFEKDGGGGVSQSAVNLLLNGELAGSISSRGTGGKIASAMLGQPLLSQGYYTVELAHTKPGITVRSISVRSDKRLPDNTEKDLVGKL